MWTDPHNVQTVQRWFAAVITHPDGVQAGADSEEAQQLIRLGRDQLTDMVTPSANQTAVERMQVYANAYWARLIEVLEQSFRMTRRVLGNELFAQFAFEYLQKFPSTNYSLGKLGDHFAQFLSETRPDLDAEGNPPASPTWPDFLIEMVTYEHAIETIFDGKGVEKLPLLSPEALSKIDANQFASARIGVAPCVQVHEFAFPIHDCFSELRELPDEAKVDIPAPRRQWAALHRVDYVVRRFKFTEPQARLLLRLQQGDSLAGALAIAGECFEGDDDTFSRELQSWFAMWSAQGMLLRVVMDE